MARSRVTIPQVFWESPLRQQETIAPSGRLDSVIPTPLRFNRPPEECLSTMWAKTPGKKSTMGLLVQITAGTFAKASARRRTPTIAIRFFSTDTEVGDHWMRDNRGRFLQSTTENFRRICGKYFSAGFARVDSGWIRRRHFALSRPARQIRLTYSPPTQSYTSAGRGIRSVFGSTDQPQRVAIDW